MIKIKNEVITFIENFKSRGDRKKIEEFFLNGCCYWFAFILDERFNRQGSILYDIKNNHFVYMIEGNFFVFLGWLGDTPPKDTDYEFWDVYHYYDPIHAQRLHRDCIDLDNAEPAQ